MDLPTSRVVLAFLGAAALMLQGLPASAVTLPPPPPPFSRPVVTAFPGTPFVTCLQGQFEAPLTAPSDPQHWFLRPTATGPLTLEVRAVAINPVDESGSIMADLFDVGTGTRIGGVTVAHPTGAAPAGSANVMRFSAPVNAGARYRLEVRRGPASIAGTREAHHYRLGFSGVAVEVGANTPALPNALEGDKQLFHINVDAGEILELRLDNPLAPTPVGPQSSTLELRDDFGVLLRSVVGGTLPYSLRHGPFATGGSLRVIIQANHHYTFTKGSGTDQGLYFDACPPAVQEPPPNRPPTVSLNAPDRIFEGSRVLVGALASDPDGDQLSTGWDWDEEFVPSADGRNATLFAGDGPRTATVTVTVIDGRGGKASASRTITVDNLPPSAVLNLDGNSSDALRLNEGSSFTIALRNPTDPSPVDTSVGFSYAFDCGAGNGYTDTSVGNEIRCSTTDNGTRTVRAKIRDKDGGSREYVGTVEVVNVAPTVGAISAPLDPIKVGTTISASAPFTDPGSGDTHTGNINWGDGTISPTTITNSFSPENSSDRIASGTHTYTAAGVYTLVLGILDDDQQSLGIPDDQPRTSTFQYVVVYDPQAGFVSGSGWIDSPAGALTADPNATGRATLGFVSRYVAGSTTPKGSIRFQLRASSSYNTEASTERLRFQSDALAWLVVSGGRAQFQGTGTANGVGGYRFIATAVDGQFSPENSSDRFRMKIWNDQGVLYDNELGIPDDQPITTSLRAGNIVIHK